MVSLTNNEKVADSINGTSTILSGLGLERVHPVL